MTPDLGNPLMSDAPNNDAPLERNGKPRYGPGSGFHGKPGRSGPPKGNRNGLRHGLRAGKRPKDAKYIEVRLNMMRRELEDACLAIHKEIGPERASTIRQAIDWERHRCLCQRWFRLGKLAPADMMKYSEA